MVSYVQFGFKWGAPVMGTSGGQVTWSFAVTPGRFYQFDAAITQATYQALVRDAFAAWEAVANIDFVEVADSAAANVRLGWDGIDGPHNVLGEAYTTWRNNSVRTADHGEVRFDTAETFSLSKLVHSPANFYALALHEIGHIIGLDHTDDAATVMFPYIGQTIALSAGEIAGAQSLYGAPVAATPAASRIAKDGGTLAFDVDGNAGQAYRLYQTAFDRTPDAAGLGFWIDQKDAGVSLDAIARNFIASPEFQSLYGASPSDELFVDLLYQNVMDREPDAGGYAYWTDRLEDGLSRSEMLIGFSESAENRQNVAAAIDDGIWYV